MGPLVYDRGRILERSETTAHGLDELMCIVYANDLKPGAMVSHEYETCTLR